MSAVSTETSVPRQRDASDAALVETLMRQAPIGMAMVGPDLRFRWVNAALAQVVGVTEADHLEKTPGEAWPEELAARADAALAKVLADGTAVTESGYPGGHAATWFAVSEPDGTVSAVGLIMSESTGREAADELRRSEERYRSLVQGGAQVVWVAS